MPPGNPMGELCQAPIPTRAFGGGDRAGHTPLTPVPTWELVPATDQEPAPAILATQQPFPHLVPAGAPSWNAPKLGAARPEGGGASEGRPLGPGGRARVA